MMKKTIICLLVLAALGLVGACFMSIYTDIAFDNDKSEREKVVIARLLQIRDAEEEFRKGHYGEFCGTLDSLIDFVKEERQSLRLMKTSGPTTWQRALNRSVMLSKLVSSVAIPFGSRLLRSWASRTQTH